MLQGAISSVGLSGSVTCTPTVGNEYGSNTAPTTLGTSATQVATQSLAAGSSYLVMAYPHAVITAGAANQHVEVDCTLSVPAGSGTPPPANPATTTKTLAVDVATTANPAAGTIPLVLPVASSTSVQPATVSCTDTAATGHAGADGQGRHDDQRDPDGQQQLIPSRGAATGLDTGVEAGRGGRRGIRLSADSRPMAAGIAYLEVAQMRLPRPSASLVVSFIALFVSLSGAGWAAINLPPHSVGQRPATERSRSATRSSGRTRSAPGKIIPGAVGVAQVELEPGAAAGRGRRAPMARCSRSRSRET